MLYLNKLLNEIKKDSLIFKKPENLLILGMASSHIKRLKKHALENQLITYQNKQETKLTSKGENYLINNPIIVPKTDTFNLYQTINVEYLKEEKIPAILTKAIRLLAKHLIEKEALKPLSLESALLEDLKNCKKFISIIENELLIDKYINLEKIFTKYIKKGVTKSIIALAILAVITDNIDKIAIYEKSQFQLKFNSLMFDRMLACPENFEIRKTEMKDEYLLKDISKIILNNTSNNILEITKGLYATIKKLDKYTMNTENLSKKTLRFRNTILNAKDPIALFERDIPKALEQQSLKDCDREFLNNLKLSLNELNNCSDNLIKDLKEFIFKTFNTNSKEDLCNRFLAAKEYIGEKELKILLNTICEINIPDELWIKRIATYINKYRVPKDWSDEDFANFKIKTKELALKFSIIESTIGTSDAAITKKYHSVFNSFMKLSKQEQFLLLRNVINV